jgi:hypothetical protein
MTVGEGGRAETVLVVERPAPERVVSAAIEALVTPPPTGRVVGLLAELPVETWPDAWIGAGHPTDAADTVTLERRVSTDGGDPADDTTGGRMPFVELSLELGDRFDWLSETGADVVSLDHLAPPVAPTDRERAFRFVHVVASHARVNGHRFVAHVDPDALDALFAAKVDGQPRVGGTVVFTCRGLLVTVHSNGTVELTRLD